MPRSARLPVVLLAALVAPACAPLPDDVGASREAIRVCPGPTVVEGVDVSTYQGTIDWPQVAGSGRGFAIARIGDGLGHDSTFVRNYAGIQAAGMVRGSYQFFRGSDDPIAQADIVIAAVPSLGPGDLPPVADVELSDGVSAATLVANLHVWVDHIHAAYGRDPYVYTSPGVWSSIAANSDDFITLPLWIANWGVTCPSTAASWSSWVFWQYSDMGSVAGISGAVDLDRFDGSMTELMAMTGSGTTTPVYAAAYVSQSFPLAAGGAHSLASGTTLDESMDLRNSGTATWDEHTCLATTQPRDRTSALADASWPAPNRVSCVAAGMTVAPGATYHFAFRVHGGAVGHYDEHFGMVEDGAVWFSDPGQGGPADDLFEGIWDVTPGVDAGTTPADAEIPAADAGDDAGGRPYTMRGGCCRVAGVDDASSGRGALAVLFVALGLVVARRRHGRAR